MRLIDSDKLDPDMTENVFCGDGAYKIFGISMEQIKNAPTVFPPPNAPLTLEELREMDGEPVWVVSLGHEFEPCWMLVMLRHDFVMANWQVCDFREYGKTWLAYRRKPEGGDRNA